MIKISSKKIAEVLGSISNVIDEEITNVSTDSRNIFKGDLFFAIKGEKFDGHEFVKQVVDDGAAFVVVERLSSEIPAIRQILVEDTLKAYAALGAYVRSLYQGKVVALTGSSGKTTLKEELKFVLKRFAPISATEGNFNNHIGVPKSLIELDMNSKFAIIEMGMSAKGELSNLTSITRPDIAIVNNVYPMHIEFFEDGIEGIAKAKAEIFEGLSLGGTAIINKDTNCFDILEEKAKSLGANIITFGKENIDFTKTLDDGVIVEAKIGGKTIQYELSTKGEHHVYNSLCVLSVVHSLGLDLSEAAAYLKDFEEVEGRGKKYNLKLANGGTYTMIDDSYSGQPEAMKLAIDVMSAMKTDGKRIAVLGKMGELGKFSKEKHIEIGKFLATSKTDVVVGVGEPMKDMLAQLPSEIEQHYFDTYEDVSALLLNKLLQNNDIVLIKGSHYGSQVYKITNSLIEKGK